ncbi:GntR family transcriptional regulator [Rhodobacteraceae bacterium CCMM004]|nr:GntR family transcriptional regulator [Rhodobacteraceae bacterium CCMM004]
MGGKPTGKSGTARSARDDAAFSGQAPIKRQVLSVQVSEMIVQGLVDGRLKPGQRLVETDIADALGVSRSPIREALSELTQLGVVTREPGRGCRIREWSRADLEDMFGVRGVLEGYAAELAAQNMTPAVQSAFQKIIARMHTAAARDDYVGMIDLDLEFHELLWSLSGNRLLQSVLEGLSQQFRLFLTMNWRFHGGLKDVPGNHERLLDGIISGEPAQVRTAMDEHVVVMQMMTTPRETSGP